MEPESNLLSNKHLLVVDDDQVYVDTVRRLLEPTRMLVKSASTVREALLECASEDFDLLLLDLRMPDGSGLEVLKAMRAKGQEAHAVVVTGFGTVDAMVEAMRLGVQDVLAKPITPEELLLCIDKAIVGTPGASNAAAGAEPEPLREIKTLMSAIVELSEGEALSSISDWHQGHVSRCVLRSLAAGAIRRIEAFIGLLHGMRAVRTALPDSLTQTCSLLESLACQRAALVSHVSDGIVGSFLRQMAVANTLELSRAEEEWARLNNVHPTHFGRLVRLQTGLTFREWRRTFRLRRALALVYRSDEQLAQVAFACGFSHPSQFDREFGAAFGIAPRRCRTALRAK